MDEDERWRLHKVTERAALLQTMPLVAAGWSPAWNVSFSQGAGLSFQTNEPDEHQLRSLLLALRPFTLNDEPVFLPRVFNILYQQLRDVHLRDALTRTREWWKAEQRGQVAIIVDGQNYPAEKIFDLWVNGVYFHDDRKKAEALETLGPIVGLSRTILQSFAVGAVSAALSTSWIIDTAFTTRRSPPRPSSDSSPSAASTSSPCAPAPPNSPNTCTPYPRPTGHR